MALVVVGVVCIRASAAIGTYAPGRPIWLAIPPIGLVVILVICGRLISRRGGRAPGSALREPAARAARRLGRAS